MLALIIAFVIVHTAARPDAGRSFCQTTTLWRGIVLPPLQCRVDTTPTHLKQLSYHISSFFNLSTSHNHIKIFLRRGQCGVCGVNMPVWGVRCVHAGVLYSCTPVRVCKPCHSVAPSSVVSYPLFISAAAARHHGDHRACSSASHWCGWSHRQKTR